MKVSATTVEGNPSLALFTIEGELDASNYQRVISKAQSLYKMGTRDLLVELTDLSFMSSSGLVALHNLVLVMHGEAPPDPESGWGAFRAIDREREAGLQKHVKLLNPQPRVRRMLETAGFDQFFEITTDQEAATASF